MRKLKIVLIGAGSASFGRGAIADVLASEELRELDVTLSLVDIDARALGRMHAFARILKEHYNSRAALEATVDRAEALPGADYVIVSVARDRWRMWEKDYYIPAAYGFRQTFGENGGPGAAFHTLRSFHLMLPIARDIERICPEALILNFTNPESRVCLAISHLTRVRAVGLCHGAFATLNAVCAVLERPREEIDLTIAGLNHFHWALGIQERSSGRDLRPEFDERMRRGDWDLDSMTRKFYELFGYLTYPAGSHPGEYVAFGHETIGPVWLNWGIGGVSRRPADTAADLSYAIEERAGRPSYELGSLEQADALDRIIDGKDPLSDAFASPTGELAVPIICDIELDRRRKELSVNIPNTGRPVSNLPADAVVEIPALVGADGVKPFPVGALPEAIAGLCALQVSIQKLLVEAYRERSRSLLLQALVIDPAVDSAVRAERMMEHMLRIQSDYLPEMR